jgi:hypothetical protein
MQQALCQPAERARFPAGQGAGEAWLFEGLALLEAAGGCAEAALLLVEVEAVLLSMRSIGQPADTTGACSSTLPCLVVGLVLSATLCSFALCAAGGVPADPFWEVTGISERALLAALAARAPVLAACGEVSLTLNRLSAWALSKAAKGLPEAEGLSRYGEVIDFLAALHCAYR